MKLHPDVNKAPNAKEQFMECKTAYDTLIDEKSRKNYDRARKGGSGFGVGGDFGADWDSFGKYARYERVDSPCCHFLTSRIKHIRSIKVKIEFVSATGILCLLWASALHVQVQCCANLHKKAWSVQHQNMQAQSWATPCIFASSVLILCTCVMKNSSQGFPSRSVRSIPEHYSTFRSKNSHSLPVQCYDV
jgi:hypothetical protein